MVVCIISCFQWHYIVKQWGDGGSGVADAAVKGLGPGYGLGWGTTSEIRDRLLGYWRVLLCYMVGVWGVWLGYLPAFTSHGSLISKGA
jgi:hypothetical protein